MAYFENENQLEKNDAIHQNKEVPNFHMRCYTWVLYNKLKKHVVFIHI